MNPRKNDFNLQSKKWKSWFIGFLRVPGWNEGEGVFLGNPEDSVWEDGGA